MLDDQIKDVEERNRKLNEELNVLYEKRAELDRQIAGLKEEAMLQRGEFRALTALRDKGKASGKETEN